MSDGESEITVQFTDGDRNKECFTIKEKREEKEFIYIKIQFPNIGT